MTESEKNAETVRRGYAAFNKGDMNTLQEMFDEKINWHIPGQSSVSGDQKGRDAVFILFGKFGGATEWTFRAELKSVAICDDGRIIGLHKTTATRGKKKLDVDSCLLFEFMDGKVIDAKEYFYDLHAHEEFWK